MKFENLKQIDVSELQEQRSAEEQVVQALPRMSGMAHDAHLAAALQEHLRATRAQLDRRDEILRRHGAEPRAHSDRSMETILGEAGR